MFRMSKASIIRSSICIEKVGRYNVRVINPLDLHILLYHNAALVLYITRTLYLPTCSVHIKLLMMDAFDIRNM